MNKLSDKARMYARSYGQPPYGKEIEGTAELLLRMAEKLDEYEILEEQGKLLKLPCAVGDGIYVIDTDEGLSDRGNMKYKIGDTFINQIEITAIDEDRTSQYFLSGCQGTGWWSEAALDDLRKMSCGDCKWKGKRHQKCSCCIRNNNMKDNYEY